MDTARIAELLAPFLRSAPKELCHSDELQSGNEESAVLSEMQLQSISIYIDLLRRWNARINLTAIRNQEEIVTRHFGECLFAARRLFPRTSHVGTAAPGCPAEQSSAATAADATKNPVNASTEEIDHGRAALQGRDESQKPSGALAPVVRLADIGSGAGFPGIPIKLWAPEISLTLIESNHKKVTFLRELARVLTLTNIDIQDVRAEVLARETFDVVTLRAVERFDSILPVAASLVAPAGRLGLLIGSAQYPTAKESLPTLNWEDPAPIPGSNSRLVAVAKRSS